MQKILPTAPSGLLRLLSSLWFQIILLVVLCLTIFPGNNAALFYGFDGAYMRHLTKFNFEWCSIGTNLSSNFLQGLGGINFPVNYWFSIPSVISFMLTGTDPSVVIIYTLITLELFLAVWCLARSMGATFPVSLAASWTASIFCMPFITPLNSPIAGFYPISSIVPYMIEHISISALSLAVLARLRANLSPKNITLGFGALILIHYSIVQFGAIFILQIPILCAFTAFCYITLSPNRRQTVALAITMLIASISLAPPLLYSMGLILNSTPAFFNAELASTYGPPSWTFISILAHGFLNLGGASTFIYLTGFAGAVIASLGKPTFFNRVAIFYLICTSLLIVSGVLTTFVMNSYRGPGMLYFEWYFWPFMFIFSIHFLKQLANICAYYLKRIANLFPQFVVNFYGGRNCSAALVPFAAFLWVFHFNHPGRMVDLPKPPKADSVVALLQEKAGISNGSSWRGLVANFCGLRSDQEPTGWGDQATHDVTQWSSLGADRRSISLWWHNIPTLFTYNQCMSPDYYYLVTRFFSQPSDIQQRSIVVLTQPDCRLLRMLGTRYLLTRERLPPEQGVHLLQDISWKPLSATDNIQEFLYELGDSNIHGWSPIQQVLCTSAKSAVMTMKSRQFDPKKSFVVTMPINKQLKPATSSAINVTKAGLCVTATASDWSLLILPFQYSHGLEIHQHSVALGKSAPTLIRVNLALTGVVFKESIDIIITNHLGPYDNPMAKVSDFLDLKQLKLADAAQN